MLGLSTKAGVEIEEGTPSASSQDAITSAIGQGNHRYSTLKYGKICNLQLQHQESIKRTHLSIR